MVYHSLYDWMLTLAEQHGLNRGTFQADWQNALAWARRSYPALQPTTPAWHDFHQYEAEETHWRHTCK